jgi:hypothetical protein
MRCDTFDGDGWRECIYEAVMYEVQAGVQGLCSSGQCAQCWTLNRVVINMGQYTRAGGVSLHLLQALQPRQYQFRRQGALESHLQGWQLHLNVFLQGPGYTGTDSTMRPGLLVASNCVRLCKHSAQPINNTATGAAIALVKYTCTGGLYRLFDFGVRQPLITSRSQTTYLQTRWCYILCI